MRPDVPVQVVRRGVLALKNVERIQLVRAQHADAAAGIDRAVHAVGKELQGGIRAGIVRQFPRPHEAEAHLIDHARGDHAPGFGRQVLIVRAIRGRPQRQIRSAERLEQVRGIGHVPREDRIARPERVIEAAQDVILVAGRGVDLVQLSDTTAQGRRRQRIQIEHGFDGRVDADVGEGAADRDQAAASVGVGHGEDSRFGEALRDAFVGDEEERLVAADRSAKAAAVLILGERRLRLRRVVEEVARVELAVPREFERRSVHDVGARPGDGVDDAAASSELRAVGVGQGLEFGDRLDAEGRAEHAGARGAVPEIRDVGVVEQEGLPLGPASGHRIDGLPAEQRTGERHRGHGGRQRDELGEVSAVQRQVGDLLLLNRRGHGARRGVHDRALAGDGDGLLDLSDRQREVDDVLAADAKGDPFVNDALKARKRRLHFIRADREIGRVVSTLLVGDDRLHDARTDIPHLDGGAGHRRARGVAHGAQDRRPDGLGLEPRPGRDRDERSDEDIRRDPSASVHVRHHGDQFFLARLAFRAG